MAQARDDSSPSDDSKVETFVWREGSSSCNRRPCWTIRHRKSSKIYDSDPHSLKIPRSHNAWKKELNLTRFANQELPEALWGDNFLEIEYGICEETGNDDDGGENGNFNKKNHRGVRISFNALEALRTWALMDMDIDRNGDEGGLNKSSKTNSTNELPTIIPHKSGRTPDRWDYTYTTNYSGSVESTSYNDSESSNGSFLTKQPDQSTLYGIKITESEDTSSISGTPTVSKSTGRAAPDGQSGNLGNTYQGTPKITVDLRPPMCKCVGGRMICAGVAQTITMRKSFRTAPNEFPEAQFSKFSSPSITISSQPKVKIPTYPRPQITLPRPSPKWVPYCRKTDGPFDMEALLNSQTSAPLHYTGTIPFWIQNLDPQSYSFLTATAVVCNGKGKSNGGFLAVLLRCFVRVNGVRVRLIDTKFIIRGQRKSSETTDAKDSDQERTPMVVLRERSWREGSWEDYTSGLRGSTDGTFQFLGTDLEQGRRASKTLPHKFPPVVEKLDLHVVDKGKEIRGSSHDRGTGGTDYNRKSNDKLKTINHSELSIEREVLKIPALHESSISKCASGVGVLVVVTEQNRIVSLDAQSGGILWEHILACSSVLSLVVHPCQVSPTLSQDTAKVVVGDDQGCVHVIGWNKDRETNGEKKSIISKQSYNFEGITEGNRERKRNVQRPSNWVEKVVVSSDGQYFAAAAGKKIMINGEIFEMEGTVYDLAFLPSGHNTASKMGNIEKQATTNGSSPTQQSLAVALYGGVTVVDVSGYKMFHRRFTVGSSAVLSFAVSPIHQSIAIGCLDKRLRIFEREEGVDDRDCNGNNAFTTLDGWNIRDWVGFDSGVACVVFSPNNQRLAALGGSILTIVDKKSEWGEAPTICLTSRDHTIGGRKGIEGRFQAIAWSTKNTLVASTDRFLHVFDVRATIDTVPKRLYPMASITLEKGFLVTGVDGEILLWGRPGIRKIKIFESEFNLDRSVPSFSK